MAHWYRPEEQDERGDVGFVRLVVQSIFLGMRLSLLGLVLRPNVVAAAIAAAVLIRIRGDFQAPAN